MDADGANPVQLTDDREFEWQPMWSPDGSRILYSSARRGARDIYMMRADGSWQTRLTSTPESYEWEPVWSPNGKSMAFSWNGKENYDIYLSDLAGTTVIQLTKDDGDDRHPSWRPY